MEIRKASNKNNNTGKEKGRGLAAVLPQQAHAAGFAWFLSNTGIKIQ